MIIREAEARDLEAIVAMLADDELGRAREAPGDPAYAAAFEELRARGDTLLVAEEAGEVVGCLQLAILPGLSHRGMRRAQIEGVRARADRRDQGVGAALVQEAEARARAAGCRLVQLTSDLRRERAHRFYERLGYAGSHLGMKKPL